MVQLVFAHFQRRPKSAKLVPTQALIQLVVVRNERQSRPSLTQHTDAMHLVILPIKELAVKLIVHYNYRRWAIELRFILANIYWKICVIFVLFSFIN